MNADPDEPPERDSGHERQQGLAHVHPRAFESPTNRVIVSTERAACVGRMRKPRPVLAAVPSGAGRESDLSPSARSVALT